VEPIEHVDGLLEVGEAEEEIVLECGARIFLHAPVAIAELRTAEAVIWEQPAVERELPAALAADDGDLRLVEQLAAAKARPAPPPEIASAGNRQARLVRTRSGEHDAIAELQFDHVGIARDPTATFFDRVHEPGEKLAAEKPLCLDDGEKVLGHSSSASSPSSSAA